VFDGLPEEYEGFISSILTRKDPYSIREIESMLVAQEEDLAKREKLIISLSTFLML